MSEIVSSLKPILLSFRCIKVALIEASLSEGGPSDESNPSIPILSWKVISVYEGAYYKKALRMSTNSDDLIFPFASLSKYLQILLKSLSLKNIFIVVNPFFNYSGLRASALLIFIFSNISGREIFLFLETARILKNTLC